MKINFTGLKTTFLSAVITVSAACASGIPVSADVAANPVISRSCPAYSASAQYSAASANDAFYYSFWYGSAPDYLAYDLSAVPEEQRQTVLAVWYNATGNYDYTVGQYGNSSNAMPSDYTIEVNAAEGGTYPEDGWVTAVTVEDNTLHSRQHVVEMTGYNWIRIMITGNDGKEGGTSSINFDIHNVSDGVSDSWIFFGDSITAGGMMNCYGTGFAELVNQIDSSYFPAQENGGIGGILSTDGAANIDRWLETFPGKYVSIAYGTNDSWGNQTGAQKYYENTAYMIEAVIEAGKIPVVPKIPYASETGVNTYLDEYNAMIDKIYEDYPQVVKGPDFDALFRENPDYLSGDGVHPNEQGYAAMRQLWAETMYTNVYTASDEPSSETTGGESIIYGDADLSGELGIADAVRIMSYVTDNAAYSMTESEINCADVYQRGDGISNLDALAVQKRLAQLLTELPESYF
ncbi:MAG: lysophospholipase [Ruminococcus sp.]|nr:lysophospholipase [Ruminococcus sp.]